MPRLLILLTLPPDVTEQYRARLSRTFPDDRRSKSRRRADKAAAALPQADMLLTFGQMMKNLKLDLAGAAQPEMGAGARHRARRHHRSAGAQASVTVTSLHGVHGAPVSEAALASMLALSRDLPGFVRAQDEHQWKRWPAKLLQGKTVGILGIGVIAEALAPKCKAMGMNVVGITLDAAAGGGLRPRPPGGRAVQGSAGVSTIWCC